MNFAFAPRTFTTGCRPIVLVTTPAHPASNARMMLLSDSVGGADDNRKGFRKRSPVNVTDRSAGIRPHFRGNADYTGGAPDSFRTHGCAAFRTPVSSVRRPVGGSRAPRYGTGRRQARRGRRHLDRPPGCTACAAGQGGPRSAESEFLLSLIH